MRITAIELEAQPLGAAGGVSLRSPQGNLLRMGNLDAPITEHASAICLSVCRCFGRPDLNERRNQNFRDQTLWQSSGLHSIWPHLPRCIGGCGTDSQRIAHFAENRTGPLLQQVSCLSRVV